MKMPFVMTHTVVIHVFVIKDILVVVHPGIVLMKMNAPWEDMIAIPRRIVPILMVVGNVPVSIHSLEMERFAKFQSWVRIFIFKGFALTFEFYKAKREIAKIVPLLFSILTSSFSSRKVVQDEKDSFSQDLLLLLNFMKQSEQLPK